MASISSSSIFEVLAEEENGLINTDIRNITLIADDHAIIKVSPDNLLHPGGIEYKMMTFNGTVPGSLLKFKEGESVRITLINDGDLVHSLNLHGITGPSQARPDLILTNGMAYKHIPWIGTVSRIPLNNDAEIFDVKPSEPTRWYIINAGPRKSLEFNFGAAMIDVLYPLPLLNQHIVENSRYDRSLIAANSTSDSDESSGLRYLISIPPGSGTIIEAIFPEQGFYFGNDHDLASILYGSGFVVSAVDNIVS